jgi:hypothetical protein
MTGKMTAIFEVIAVLTSVLAFSLIGQLPVFADSSIPQPEMAKPMDQLLRESGNGTAGSRVLLEDGFDRRDSREVGEGWVEVEGRKAFVGIAKNRLFFADTSDVVNRPQVRRSFTEAATGTLQWDFDFDWARTGDESIYRVMMQLGDGGAMTGDSPDAGVGVNLVWSVIDGEHQRLGYGKGGILTSLKEVSGGARISVTADLASRTYAVSVDGESLQTGIPFDAEVPLNTVRYLTDQLNEDHFSGRSFDNVVIAGEPGGNQPPVADAGPDQEVETGGTVTLDGSGSADGNGDPLSFSWTLTGPDLIDATDSLTGADTATPSFVADLDGEYAASLVVNDGTEASAPDTVNIVAGTDSCPGGSGDVAELETLINEANLDPGLDTITLAINCSYQLTAPLPDISSPISIEGNGSTITGNTTFRIFLVERLGELTINDLDLTNGNAATGGGGAILNAGTVILNGASSIFGNSASSSSGGGALRNNGGAVTLNDASSIFENTATSSSNNSGGGIFNNGGTVTLNDASSIRGNTGASGGGIRHNGGTVTLNDASSIFGNIATGSSGGGGIRMDEGQVTLNDASSIVGNTASGANGGGGIRVDGGTVTLNGSSSISENIPDDITPE